jgi:transglutaminase-like putative cysteine protease
VAPIVPTSLGEGLPAAVEFSMVRARETLDVGDSYTLVSNATTATEKAMREAGTDYPLEIVDRYVQLPEGFSPQVAELARTLTVSSTTPYDSARIIEAYLRTIPYNDLIAAPPDDVDPLEYFLFEIREGYCDYYASSMAMMLRVLGIPARTASGYAEGLFDEETLRYYITERDAHTWVEVFFPGLGWVEFEPTAGESPLNRLSGDEGENALENTESPQEFPTPVSENNTNQQAFDEGELLAESGQESGGLPWWAWLVALPVLLGGGIWVIRRTGVGTGPTSFAPDLPLLLFERLQRWATRLGLAQEPSQTPLEQSRKWGAALPEAKQPIQQITNSYVRYRYAQNDAQAAVNAEGSALSADAEAWKTLQPVLVSAWFKRWLPASKSVDNGQFALHNTDDALPSSERKAKRTRRPKG